MMIRYKLHALSAVRCWPLALAGLVMVSPAQAQPGPVQEPVVVTGSPRAQRVVDAPFAVSVVGASALREAGAMVNLSEALVQVPGLVVNNRHNYAQDLQISARGYGARAAFGVRGLRLYADGIPATMPDGQGQVAHIDLAGAERIEVLRGPFSVLYGNNSGGVIAVFTAPVTAAQGEVAADAGSFGLRQLRVGLATPLGQGLDLRASATRTELDGFRPQSAAERSLANLRLGWRSASDTLTVALSHHEQAAQDPLGLRPEDFAKNPRQTAPQALEYDTRKTIRQTQGGAAWRHLFGDGALRALSLSAYHGQRAVVQFQAIPSTVQVAATHGGGVVDFDRQYQGLDARLDWRLGAGDLATGVAFETQRDSRRGWRNFTGSPAAPTAKGVYGDLRRSEVNTAETREAYVQLHWPLSPAVALTGGLRSGQARMRTEDRYLANGNDSGRLDFDYTNPVLGLHWRLSPGWAVHASVARGFESPTLGELAYAPATQVPAGGFNRGLAGQTSVQAELGSKWRGAAGWLDASVFTTDTDDEIGVLSNTGGRSVFQNVGRTLRQGLEFGGGWQPAPGWRLQAAYTFLDAHYRDTRGTVVAGKQIVGTVRASLWAQAAWRPGVLPGELALEWRAVDAMPANDANTVRAPGYGLLHLRWSHALKFGAADTLELLARVDNLTDKVHVGSVIVNDGNSRFFETGTPRSLLVSARWLHRF